MENKSSSKTFEDIINEIESKSNDGDYIYRGEDKKYEQVSSALYREYLEDIDTELEGFNVIYAQREMLKIAKNHIGESPVGPLEDFMDIAKHLGYTENPMRNTAIEELVTKAIGETIAETADLQLLTELQHYGGKTNLIGLTQH